MNSRFMKNHNYIGNSFRPVHPPVQNSVVVAMVFSNFM